MKHVQSFNGVRAIIWCAGALLAASGASAQDRAINTKVPFPVDPLASVPKLPTIVASKGSELAEVVERYQADQGVISRRYDGVDSPDQRKRLRAFYASWRTRLKELEFDKLSQEGKADYLLLDNHLRYQQDRKSVV